MSKIPKGYKQTEIGVIPEDWEVKKLGDIADVRDGTHESPKYYKNGVIFITSKNIISGTIDYADISYITKEDAANINKRSKVDKGDILMSMIGTIGNCVLIDFEPDFCIKNVALFKPQKINEYYLIQLLRSSYYQAFINSKLAGGIQKFLPLNIMRELPIPSPTVPEEQALVGEKLHEVDELIKLLEKQIKKKYWIKQGAIQELFKSKEGWILKALEDIAEIKDGTHQTPKYMHSGIPFYSVENVTRNDFDNVKFISEEEHLLLTKSFKIEKGDILMTRIGSIGECKLVDWDVNASFYVSLALLKIKAGFSAEYLTYYSNSSFFKREIELNSLQSAIPQKINLGQISMVKIEIPECIEEQIHIASILSDMDAEIAALENKLAKYKKIKEGMMQNLLTGRIRLI